MKEKIKIERTLPDVALYDNIVYGHRIKRFNTGFIPLSLHLMRPNESAMKPFEKRPLLVFVGGGGWKDSSPGRYLPNLLPFVYKGFVVASVGYRPSGAAPFPAQIQDVKAAIRFLRANANLFGIDVRRVAVMGESAGGHLAALVGTSVGFEEFASPDYPEQSDAAQAVVCLYTPVDLEEIARQEKVYPAWPAAEDMLLGGPVASMRTLAQKASPLNYVTEKAPPFLLLHGDADVIVSYKQSEIMYQRLSQLGVPVDYYLLEGAGHAAPEFFQPETIELISDFINRYI